MEGKEQLVDESKKKEATERSDTCTYHHGSYDHLATLLKIFFQAIFRSWTDFFVGRDKVPARHRTSFML